MMPYKPARALRCALLLMLLFLLPGCQPEETLAPAGAVEPAATLPPTSQPATAPPAITNTPIVPTLAEPQVIINTPAPEPTPVTTESATAAPTATIPGLIGPEFPPDVNPLTGEQVSDPSVLQRRPLAIKISNYPPEVRPQSGINNADLIFEHYAEGGVTRFTAIFYSQDADPVGSIRSGRLIDLEIPVMYDAAFGYSGSSGPVRQMFRESSFFERIVSPDFAHGGYYRVEDPNKAVEHTLFTNTYNLRYILDERGQNRPPEFQNGMTFREEPFGQGTPAGSIELQYSATSAYWQYISGRYWRWTDGTLHTDANTGTQLNFRNVIVLSANHVDTDILENLIGGGSYSIQIQIWGEGPVSIFRDGLRFDGRWRRENPQDMLTFYDLDGNPLPLGPGNSFIQLVPLGFTGLFTTP